MCSLCASIPCHPRCPNADEPKVVETCICCGYDIYEGDEYYDIDGEPWCKECINSSMKVAEVSGF